MISLDHYFNIVADRLRLDLRPPQSSTGIDPNAEQRSAVSASPNQPLFMVAGPGSGKTTASTLRILKLILVDGLDPSQMLATTFTRKAAASLRSRVIDYGETLRETLRAELTDSAAQSRLERIDLNAMRLGTLDSIAQDLLTEFRLAGAAAPHPLENLARHSVFVTVGVLEQNLHQSQSSFPALFKEFPDYDTRPPNAARKAALLVDIHDRLGNDRVNIDGWLAGNPENGTPRQRGVHYATNAIQAVRQAFVDAGVCDFAGLSGILLESFETGALEPFLRNLRFILVDEYQDTNLLQEAIYFAFARQARTNNGSICVVGDDDQSIYRFRGATVDLFQRFEGRLQKEVGVKPQRIELMNNYRSTPVVVNFVNQFIALDPRYQTGRVQPLKPEIVARRQDTIPYPIMRMFRPTRKELARDLADFIHDVVHGKGRTVIEGDQTFRVAVDPEHGSPNDVALLMNSVMEHTASGIDRLPKLLRDELAGQRTPLKVFNPRGQALRDQPEISFLLGAALLCLDPEGEISAGLRLTNDESTRINDWRNIALSNLTKNQRLQAFVARWQTRSPSRSNNPNRAAGERVGLNELFYKLVAHIPDIQYDIEQLALLEAVTRTVTAASVFAKFNCEVIFGRTPLDGLVKASIAAAIRDVFAPIANGAIDTNEDLLVTLPRDRISIMTVHQAKGLEFPITIVDVGSDADNMRSFKAWKRYPGSPSRPHLLENELRPYSDLDNLNRSALDRAFDDMVRQAFVAFSRAQDVLILVGCDRLLEEKKSRRVPNIATGWIRPQGNPGWPEDWPWRGLPQTVEL